MKRIILLILLYLGVAFSQEDFKSYKEEIYRGVKQEKIEFEKYKREIEREFREYKRIVYEEYENYKKEILKHWDKPEISTKKKFVEYSPDFKVKKVVNFEKGEIKIEVISKKKPSIKEFAKKLRDFITEDKKTAYKKDVLSQRIEKKLKRKIKHLKTDKIEKKPILLDLFVQKKKITQKEVNKAVINLLKRAKFLKRKYRNKNIYSMKIKLPPKRILIKAKEYKPLVEKHAKKYRLKPSLILAIIHTESSFNPLARSPVPAYGLMQIVPQTAGKDATRIIYGKPVLLSPSYLYNDRNNILIGSTYFYLLYYRYLKNIKDPVSRLYCAIAAYNTGAGNVARAFTGTTNIRKAAKIINRMSPGQVYEILMRKLPYEETKNYLKRVSRRIRIYQNI